MFEVDLFLDRKKDHVSFSQFTCKIQMQICLPMQILPMLVKSCNSHFPQTLIGTQYTAILVEKMQLYTCLYFLLS